MNDQIVSKDESQQLFISNIVYRTSTRYTHTFSVTMNANWLLHINARRSTHCTYQINTHPKDNLPWQKSHDILAHATVQHIKISFSWFIAPKMKIFMLINNNIVNLSSYTLLIWKMQFKKLFFLQMTRKPRNYIKPYSCSLRNFDKCTQ